MFYETPEPMERKTLEKKGVGQLPVMVRLAESPLSRKLLVMKKNGFQIHNKRTKYSLDQYKNSQEKKECILL
jgi:hypothetical protein